MSEVKPSATDSNGSTLACFPSWKSYHDVFKASSSMVYAHLYNDAHNRKQVNTASMQPQLSYIYHTLLFVRFLITVGATIRFSKDGRLLLSNGKKIVFCYNPFTRAIIFLPDLPDNYVLGGMSFSSVPTSRDCVVIAVSNWFDFVGYDEIFFLVTEPGKGATDWDVRDFDYEGRCEDYFMPCINNPVFYDRAFYCLDCNGMLGVFNMTGDSSWEILPKSLIQVIWWSVIKSFY
ncbi:F-box/kelch-repeat protein At3g18720-like isoform X4 [Papaver somniferum]|uniref:F-box/kelch-repeat protein At3g18720-like isoform X4 n=1 Tax=Papaver somniferum TaxID=3469 RepID=UPI000E6F78D5|nr:F-box/kelch-repeat protein At3g18720-like isoform X4 [Papaver somniferum]